jgi:hypothetical protein
VATVFAKGYVEPVRTKLHKAALWRGAGGKTAGGIRVCLDLSCSFRSGQKNKKKKEAECVLNWIKNELQISLD